MRDRVEHAIGVHLRAALQQAIGRFAPVEMHRAVECSAVEPVLVDIAQEITRGHRCALGLDFHRDIAHGGFDHDQLGRVDFRLGQRFVLRGDRRGEKGERGQRGQNPCH